MAKFTVSNFARAHQFWGDLPEPGDPALITVRTATTFSFGVDPGGAYAGWTFTVKGAGFKYLANSSGVLEATDGAITSITIRDAANHVVLTIDTFPLGERPQLADLYAQLFNTGSQVSPDMFDFFTSLQNFGDTIIGSDNNDDLFTGYNLGNDNIDGRGGDDFIRGSAGNDVINGGLDFDTLSFFESFYDKTAFKGVTANLTTGTVADCWGGSDTISGFEELDGSRFKDTLIGSDADNEWFSGLRGADTIDGGGGLRDWVYYGDDARYGGTRGIIANLAAGTIRDGFGNIDTVSNIERVQGTNANDIFIGSDVNNTFRGHGGKDSYDGGLGNDRVNFYYNTGWGATAGVNVDLTRATNQIRNDGFGNVENAISIENISGSSLNDTIKGSNAVYNFLEGDGGADTLTGGTGADGFGYYAIGDFGDTIRDFVSGTDELWFGPGDLAGLGTTPISFRVGTSVASAAGTSGAFYFNAANHTLFYDQDGTGSAFLGVAVLTIQAGGTIAAGDLFLDIRRFPC